MPLFLAACGGAAMGTPTPIPAHVVEPEQPTPVYSTAQPQFRLEQPDATPLFAGTPIPVATTPLSDDQLRAELLKAMLMNLPPSAMGIATGGATIYAEPGATVVGSVPAGGSITVTGRSQDGNWLAVYTNEALTGWVAAGTLRLYGADDLETVTTALSPAPVATLLAEAMRTPALSIDAVLATRAVTPELPEGSATPHETETPQAAAASAVQNVMDALVGSASGDVSLLVSTDADAEEVAVLPQDAPLIALARSADATWLFVRTPLGDGWLPADQVTLAGDVQNLPVDSP